MWLPSWCATCLIYCSLSEVKFVCTEEEGACVLTRNLSLSLKPCAGSRACAGCTVCRHSPFHTSCAWFTGSAGHLASPHPIPFLQLLLLCFVHPLSLPSNLPPLPVLNALQLCVVQPVQAMKLVDTDSSPIVAKRQCQQLDVAVRSSVTGCGQLCC